MAKPDALTTEQSDLRRRARRRLVGAVALVLLAVVVLPMVFNPEPKPLGPDVDIRIPDQATPFEPAMPTPAPDQEAAKAGVAGDAPGTAAAAPASATTSPATPAKPPDQPAKADRTVADQPAIKAGPPTMKPIAQPPKSEQAAGQDKTKGEAKSSAPASEGFAAKGYYLQLGAFTNEGNARQLADKARAAGFNPAVQTVAGQVRVRVGPYAERKDALEMQAKLRAKGFGPVLLGP